MATLFNIGHILTFVQNEDDPRESVFSLLNEKVRLLFPGGNDSPRYQDRIKELEDRVNDIKIDLHQELNTEIAAAILGRARSECCKSHCATTANKCSLHSGHARKNTQSYVHELSRRDNNQGWSNTIWKRSYEYDLCQHQIWSIISPSRN